MTVERIALLLIGCLNVGAGALLAYDGLGMPLYVRAGIVVTQVVTASALAAVKSWGDAAPQDVLPPHG